MRPRVPIAAPRRNALGGKVRDGEAPSPAREARALPATLQLVRAD